jgi:pimeloyl-ACP methyl ester carboxylesterase
MTNANRTPLIHSRLDPTSQRLVVEDVRVGLALAQAPATGYSVTGAGTPVVLLHSTLSHKGQWSPLAASLAHKFQVIAVDLIGHGDTPERGGDVTLDDEARSVESVLRSLYGRVPSFHLVGHSYGGGVALRLARNCRQRIKSLVLFEPTSFHVLPHYDTGRDDIRSVAAVMKAALKAGAPDAAVEVFIDYWTGVGAYAALPAQRKAAFAGMVPTALEHFRALLEEPAMLDDYIALTAPACLVAGTASPDSSLRVTELLAAALPTAQLFCVEGGHMAPVTHAHRVNPIIERFLAVQESQVLGEAA